MTIAIFGVFFVALIIALPIGVAVCLASILPNLLDPSFTTDVQFVLRSMISGIDSSSMLAIPLFMLSGDIMSKGGISKKLFNTFAAIVGKRTAGMPCAVVLTCLFFGAISGSGPATCAAVGAMSIPILTNLGYDKVFSGALVATAAGLGVIIPPSIPYITVGLVTGVSVGALFTAGIIPGILIAVCLMVYCIIYCKRNGEDKEKVAENYERIMQHGFFHVLRDSFWALLTPVIILGGIYSGIVTPTEAACVSVFYALFVCLFLYRSMKLVDIIGFLRGAVRTYAPLCILLAMARAFSKVLTVAKVPQSLGEFISTAFNQQWLFLLCVIVILLLLGMVLDVGPANIILAPILLPVAEAFGMNPVHFCIILVVCLSVGFVTPPFGMNLFVVAPMIDTPVMSVGKKAAPFILAFIVALLLIAYIPPLTLLLI